MINEIMYNPIESDNYFEWIELYNPANQSINLSGWTITDNYGKDYIEGNFDNGTGSTVIPANGFTILTDHGTKIYDNSSISNDTVLLFVDDKSIGNGLGNSGDMLVLKNSSDEIVDSVEWGIDYNDTNGTPTELVEEGFTLSRINDIDSDNSSIDFYKGFPTPGFENNIYICGETEILCEKKSFEISRYKASNVSFSITNLGRFTDDISMRILNITDDWSVTFDYDDFLLEPHETKNISLHVKPCNLNGCKEGEVTLCAFSEYEYNESDCITLYFEILGPDLWVKNIQILDEEKVQTNNIYQGDIVRIKSFLKNLGNQDAYDVNVCFYLDKISSENFIGSKFYENISRYQKYPSVLFDTVNVESGFHKIIVVADKEDTVDELDELNNVLSISFYIVDTSPDNFQKQVLITSFYYNARSGLNNEFIKIFNPTNKDVDISNWYLTNNPEKNKKNQHKIVFANNSNIPANSVICIAQEASGYFFETGEKPDFEYFNDTCNQTPNMIMNKQVFFSNKGGMLALKNEFNHTVDLVAYGNKSIDITGWNGEAIPSVGNGIVLKRRVNDSGFFVDSNSFSDWDADRVFRIGQSDFDSKKFQVNSQIKAFVSPNSSFNAIVQELRCANETIYLNMYEFTHSVLCDELVKLLLRNISVNIFLEGSPVGGISYEEKFLLKRLDNYGANIRFIVSRTDEDVYARYDFDHAKYLIIDNKTTIVMSCNWGYTGVPIDPSYGNREWGVVIQNRDVAEYFRNVFLDDWNPLRCDSVSYDEMNLSYPSDFFMSNSYYADTYVPAYAPAYSDGYSSVLPVVSPDNSFSQIYNLIESSQESIYIEQLYIYEDWGEGRNPLLDLLVNKKKKGVDVKVILNYNPYFFGTNDKLNKTKNYLEGNNIEVKFIFTNWSVFSNVHNKGVIVDNKSVLISSINWNYNSFMNNREAGVIVENESIAKYFTNVFLYDWSLKEPVENNTDELIYSEQLEMASFDYKNMSCIIVIYSITFLIIARDWRKRRWT